MENLSDTALTVAFIGTIWLLSVVLVTVILSASNETDDPTNSL